MFARLILLREHPKGLMVMVVAEIMVTAMVVAAMVVAAMVVAETITNTDTLVIMFLGGAHSLF
jgi:hypothetical protein